MFSFTLSDSIFLFACVLGQLVRFDFFLVFLLLLLVILIFVFDFGWVINCYLSFTLTHIFKNISMFSVVWCDSSSNKTTTPDENNHTHAQKIMLWISRVPPPNRVIFTERNMWSNDVLYIEIIWLPFSFLYGDCFQYNIKKRKINNYIFKAGFQRWF